MAPMSLPASRCSSAGANPIPLIDERRVGVGSDLELEMVAPLDRRLLARVEGHRALGKASVTSKPKGKKNAVTLASGSYSIAAGKKATVRLPLTKAGRKLVASSAADLAATVCRHESTRPQQLRHRIQRLPRRGPRRPRPPLGGSIVSA
jgi:hypothetical protein